MTEVGLADRLELLRLKRAEYRYALFHSKARIFLVILVSLMWC